MNKILLILLTINSGILFSDSHNKWERTEYENGFAVEVMTLDKTIEFKVYGKTTGWIALGFEPSMVMKDSDIIIGYVSKNEVLLEDHFSHALTNHKSDEKLGGENNVTLIDSSEENGVTMIHFSLPIESKDKYDKALKPGYIYKIIYATGKKDNIKTFHNYRGVGELYIPVKGIE